MSRSVNDGGMRSQNNNSINSMGNSPINNENIQNQQPSDESNIDQFLGKQPSNALSNNSSSPTTNTAQSQANRI